MLIKANIFKNILTVESKCYRKAFTLSYLILPEFSIKQIQENVGIDLFSRLVAKQVFSAPHSLTSVFGMGTGGPCAIVTPTAE